MIIWTTIATYNYVQKAAAYLESVSRNRAGIDRLAFGCAGFDPAFIRAIPAGWETYHIDDVWLDERLGNPGNGCIQHGNFLPALGAKPDDVIVCTDGDITMQRPLTGYELAWLRDWPEGKIGIGPNAWEGDTLLDEAARIQPRVSNDDLARLWGGGPAPLCGNAGVLVARGSTWLEFWRRYLELFRITRPLFGHIAVQQWTINLAIEQMQAREILPYSFHAHRHYGHHTGCTTDAGGEARYQGQLIALAHHWW